MVTTIILRFRDLVANTIPEHQSIILEAKYVWWGWWRKPNESKRFEELSELKAKLKEATLQIGLYDRSQPRFFRATLTDCIFSSSDHMIESPLPAATPRYYSNTELPAWFRLTNIEQINESEFVRLFSDIPVGDDTFFPLSADSGDPKGRSTSLSSGLSKLRGKAIIHLSDLHFGSDFGFPSNKEPGKVPLLEILQGDIKKQAGQDVGLLVVSGDITSRGDGSPLFTTGKPFLHSLRESLGLSPEQVVIVPGNHDIALKDFAVTYDHEAAYDAFISIFYGSPRKQMDLLQFVLPTGRHIEVLTINSVKLRSKETLNYGWVDWRAYEDFLASLPESTPGTLRIAILHHHLVSAAKDERLPDPQYPFASVSVTLNAGSVIEGLQRHGFSLVLHGHQHSPAVHRISRGRLREDDSNNLEGLDVPLYLVAGGSAGVAASRIDGDIRDNTYGILWVNDDRIRLGVRAFNPSGNVRTLHSAEFSLSSK